MPYTVREWIIAT